MALLDIFSRWLKLKVYQFEVTLAVSMLTPLEKFFIYSVIFLLISLTTIASVLYLPQHIAFLINRAWFYIHGDSVNVVEVAKEAVQTLAQSAAASTVTEAVAGTAATAVREL